MLLSFAQFEREVTAERIRDKIAASKAKGMWMGGTPPLGYRPDGRSLAIVPEHAAIVRDIFARYLATGNVRLVAEQLVRDGIGAPLRTRGGSGKPFGGVAFTRGQIYAYLKCPTYVGEVHHNDNVYPGLHAPIIDRDLWEQVQARLADNVQGHRRGARTLSQSLLAGRIVDGDGAPLIATHATKPVPSNVEGGRTRYRYYVARALHHGTSDTGLRIPAREIEALVAGRVAALFDDAVALIAAAWLEVPADRYVELQQRCAGLAADQRRHRREALMMVEQVRVHDTGVEIICRTEAIATAVQATLHADAPATIMLSSDATITRSGPAMKLVTPGGAVATGTTDRSLLRQMLVARRWWAELRLGEIDVTRLAAREKVTPSYMTRIVRLAFLSPAVTQAILSGTQRAGVDVAALTLTGGVDPSWPNSGGRCWWGDHAKDRTPGLAS